jgi:peptidoglycan hydrolase-like protein with peptidoglycan-binding domain
VLNSGLDVDGEFGPLTEGACKKFRRICRLQDNGVCGQQTWASLDVALDKLRR